MMNVHSGYGRDVSTFDARQHSHTSAAMRDNACFARTAVLLSRPHPFSTYSYHESVRIAEQVPPCISQTTKSWNAGSANRGVGRTQIGTANAQAHASPARHAEHAGGTPGRQALCPAIKRHAACRSSRQPPDSQGPEKRHAAQMRACMREAHCSTRISQSACDQTSSNPVNSTHTDTLAGTSHTRRSAQPISCA